MQVMATRHNSIESPLMWPKKSSALEKTSQSINQSLSINMGDPREYPPSHLRMCKLSDGSIIYLEPRSGNSFYTSDINREKIERELRQMEAFRAYMDKRKRDERQGAFIISSIAAIACPSIKLPLIKWDQTHEEATIASGDIAKMVVVGQMRESFILAHLTTTRMQNLLVAFDQHAIHERVRFEQKLQKMNDDSTGSLELIPPLTWHLGRKWPVDRLVRGLKTRYNIVCKVTAAGILFLERIPSVWSLKEVTRQKLEDMIDRVVSSEDDAIDLGQLRSWAADSACHGAIRMGEKLSIQESSNLLYELSKCIDPFHCAHGRVAIVPIVYF